MGRGEERRVVPMCLVPCERYDEQPARACLLNFLSSPLDFDRTGDCITSPIDLVLTNELWLRPSGAGVSVKL